MKILVFESELKGGPTMTLHYFGLRIQFQKHFKAGGLLETVFLPWDLTWNIKLMNTFKIYEHLSDELRKWIIFNVIDIDVTSQQSALK